jgi:hypothetical protein
MSHYEYKVVPAPRKGVKAKGVKTGEGRFAHALEQVMNDHAAEGWEYQRAEMLPSVERTGLASSSTEWRNVLVFRRLVQNDADLFAPELLPAPEEDEVQDSMARTDAMEPQPFVSKPAATGPEPAKRREPTVAAQQPVEAETAPEEAEEEAEEREEAASEETAKTGN